MGCVHAKSESHVKQKSQSVTEKKPVRPDRLDCRRKSFQTSDKILENVTISSHTLDEDSQILAKTTIDSHYLFNDLSEQEKEKLISELIQVRGKKNEYVFKQGEKGSCFFIIKHGSVGVEINGKQVKVMQAGEMFGELALIYCAARSASIKCLDGRTSFLAMKSYIFKKTMRDINLRNAARLQNVVNRVKIFSYLTNKQKHIIANNLVRQPFQLNHCIFKVDEPANSFYIIEKGSIRIQIPGKEEIIIQEEDSFGENSFYQNGQRSGSAYANDQHTILISIGRQEIENCLGESVSGLIHHNLKKWALTRSDLFSKYCGKELNVIADSFQVKFSKGDNQVLMHRSKHPKGFIICMEGLINWLPPGTMFCDDFYGKKENTLIEDVIKNNKGAYAVLDFKALSKINQNIKLGKTWQSHSKLTGKLGGSIVSIGETKKQKAIANQKAKSEFESMQMLKKLGEGQFGEVYLVRNPNHGNALYAIKCIKIALIKKEGIEECLVSERKILSKVTCPAIVGFVEAYKDQQYIYFLMEFINGVEMFDILREIGLVNKAISSFYIATLILAVEYLHNQGIIYRDLKPENAVVGHDGKLLLIDLGTAKHLNEDTSFRTFTIIGTPHYMAPEVFQGKGYSFQADYWSLGVMLYQLICGNLPYGRNSNDPYGIFAEIMSQPLQFPSFFNDLNAELVMNRLLCKNSKQRSISNGFTGIKKMTYFASIQWDKLLSRQNAPYIPKKFRNVSSSAHYKNVKGELFLGEFYKVINEKNKNNLKPLIAEDAELQIWDSDFV